MKSKFISIPVSIFITIIARLFHFSYRYRFHNNEHITAAKQQYGGYLYSCWHRHVLASTLSQYQGQFVVMVSKSGSADPIDMVCRSFGHKVVRGSSQKGNRDKGGKAASQEMTQILKDGYSGAVTADGPTGPVFKAKPGVVEMARQAHYPIIPFAGIPSRAWQFNSWDKILLPKPFSRIDVYYGPAIPVPSELTTEQFSAIQQEVDLQTNALEEKAYKYKF